MKIMLCYDGSDEAKEGINQAIKQARVFKAEVHIVTSVKLIDKDYPKIMEPIKDDHEKIKALFSENNIPCETVVIWRHGEDAPGESLVLYARENNVDQVIIGLKRRSKLGKLVFGSAAQYVLLKVDCPILGVKTKNNRIFFNCAESHCAGNQ
jgi:nucleotide-binding universal stress UspA family protein